MSNWIKAFLIVVSPVGILTGAGFAAHAVGWYPEAVVIPMIVVSVAIVGVKTLLDERERNRKRYEDRYLNR